MQLIRGLHNLKTTRPGKKYAQNRLNNVCAGAFDDVSNGCVLTIGNFDGIHLGHQEILSRVGLLAAKLDLPSVVMIFEPLPVEYFAPDKAPVRLMNLREKLISFQETAIDYVLVCRFDKTFATLTAQQFVQQVLVDALNVKHVVVGDDFCFGQNRQGNFASLQDAGKTFGFAVSDMPTFCVAEQRISSTRLRQALATDILLSQGLQPAETLLGRPFFFDGRVIHGRKLGRQLGFRTLNLNPKRLQMPVSGVFAVRVLNIANQPWPGVANIGVRPTVKGERPSIEVHLFNWDKDLYGAHVQVELVQFIRPEQKFNNLDELKAQIEKDAAAARFILKI